MPQPLITELELRALAMGTESGYEPEEIEAAILSASSTAYSYLRARYTLPLVSWGYDVRLAVARLAYYTAKSQRGFDPSQPADAVVLKNNDDAVRWLQAVANNAAAADVVDTTPAAQLAAKVVSKTRRGY